MASNTNNWLKKIFSVGSINLFIAIVGLFVAYKTLMVDAGGELKISYPSGVPENGIFEIDRFTAEGIDGKLPQFSNPSKYVLKDFYLSYTFSGNGIKVEPSGYFEVIRSRDKTTLTYRPEKLAAGMSVEEPLIELDYTGSGDLSVDIDASFNGGNEPFRKSFTFKLADRKVSGTTTKPISTRPSLPAAEEKGKTVTEVTDNGKETVIVKSGGKKPTNQWLIVGILVLILVLAFMSSISVGALYESTKEIMRRKINFSANIRTVYSQQFYDKPMRSLNSRQRLWVNLNWWLAWFIVALAVLLAGFIIWLFIH